MYGNATNRDLASPLLLVTPESPDCVMILANVRYLVRTHLFNRSFHFCGFRFRSAHLAVGIPASLSESTAAGHAYQSGVHARRGVINLPVCAAHDFRGFSGLPQKHTGSTICFANNTAHIPVGPVAVFFASTSKSPLSYR